MSYTLTMHKPDLLWVVMDGHLDVQTADAYFNEVWQTLDACPAPTDMLVDGRKMKNAKFEARRRTEQVVHHPNLGHMAFIVSQTHLLWLAPLARLVNGIGLFGNEQEALAFLETARTTPSGRKVDLFNLSDVPEHPFAHKASEPAVPRVATQPHYQQQHQSTNGNGVGGAVRPPDPAPEPKVAVPSVVAPAIFVQPALSQPVFPVKNLSRTLEAMPERPERRRR